ncbi:MAG: hypothetical protein LKF79_02470 [Solobacterium sp.]|jgi:hypothetical protein|nr:hypothetical protein [Solobacterium sp.]MCH4221892.1 hypothetical protein [Solobacterium sp.]MCH4265492.1 hypothetical protein [Solobacterium sp.]
MKQDISKFSPYRQRKAILKQQLREYLKNNHLSKQQIREVKSWVNDFGHSPYESPSDMEFEAYSGESTQLKDYGSWLKESEEKDRRTFNPIDDLWFDDDDDLPF